MPPPPTPHTRPSPLVSTPPRALSGPRNTPVRKSSSSRNIGKSRPPSLSSIATPDPAVLLRNNLTDSRTNNTEGTDAAKFDPIEFLNKYYSTEQQLTSQLPSLHDAVIARRDSLNDTIATALQHQSETAERTRRQVQDAKASIIELEKRILNVKVKAGLSERAVQEITANLQRLDGAKQQLQTTITTLKRLHTLVHAVEQLRLVTLEEPIPDFTSASHVVEVIGELMEHFTAFTNKVPHMRMLVGQVRNYKLTLRAGVVRGFRIVVFGVRRTRELEGWKKSPDDDDEDDMDVSENAVVFDVPALQGGTKFIEALGEEPRKRFIHDFCQDLLGEYLKKFDPPNHKPEKRINSFKAAAVAEPENTQSGLDHIDKRFAWFMQTPIKIVSDRFPGVFPAHWNLHVCLASMFLRLVGALFVVTIVCLIHRIADKGPYSGSP